MLQILRAYDIPDKSIDAIGFLYQGKKARVIAPNGITDFFYLHLTSIVLDYAMRRVIDGREEELGFNIDQREVFDVTQCS